MPLFSAFARFGHLAYSSKDPRSKGVYESMLRALGPGYTTTEFDDNRMTATAYADAIEIANCLLCLERAVSQQYPLKAQEMLSHLERMHGVHPGPRATLPERRAAVAARMAVARGPLYGNVVEVLQNLLGSDFVGYDRIDSSDFVDNEAAGIEDRANFVKPGTEAHVYRLDEPAMPSGSAIMVRATLLTNTHAQAGDTAVIDGHDSHRRERITITDRVDALESLVFEPTRPHAAGALLTTQHFPIWSTNARAHFVTLTTAAAEDRETRRRVDEEMRRMMRSAARWWVGDGNGPFKVEVGKIGITPIG